MLEEELASLRQGQPLGQPKVRHLQPMNQPREHQQDQEQHESPVIPTQPQFGLT